MHYRRWLKHGDPEGGRVPNGETRLYFQTVVVNYAGDECLIWPFSRDHAGYGTMNNRGGSNYVSRLVCEHVNGPPPSAEWQAAHSCGNGHNGCVSGRHLSWKTNAENCADTIAHGRTTRGQKHGRSKLTQDEVVEIKGLLGKVEQKAIARQFGVSKPLISMIANGRAWGWLH